MLQANDSAMKLKTPIMCEICGFCIHEDKISVVLSDSDAERSLLMLCIFFEDGYDERFYELEAEYARDFELLHTGQSAHMLFSYSEPYLLFNP